MTGSKQPENGPIRILVVFNTPSLYGMERTVIETFEALRPQAAAHFLMAHGALRKHLPVLAAVEARGIPHSYFSDTKDWPKIGKPRSIQQLRSMFHAVLQGNIDVLREARRSEAIYLPGVHYLYYALFGCIALRSRGKQTILAPHDVNVGPRRVLRALAPLISRYVVPSEFARSALLAQQPHTRAKPVTVIPPALEPVVERKGPGLSAYMDWRNIVFLGQVSPHKGIDLLVSAFDQLACKYDDIALHIIGTCSDPQFERRLHDHISSEQVRQRVIFWGYRDDAREMLADAYLHVQPSRPSRFRESFGRGVVEAMSAGVPSIVFRSGALQESVVHEETGYICEDENAECLAEALLLLLSNADLRNRYGLAARQRYQDKYSVGRVRKEWLKLLRDGA